MFFIFKGPEITSTDKFSSTMGINQMSDLVRFRFFKIKFQIFKSYFFKTEEEILNKYLGLNIPDAK